jgi:hypothetical protein
MCVLCTSAIAVRIYTNELLVSSLFITFLFSSSLHYLQIVCRTELKTRAASVALLVRTAEACLQCNNFDGAVLVVGVLCDASIHRLRKTWEVAEALIPKHWDAVQHAVGVMRVPDIALSTRASFDCQIMNRQND